MRGWPRKRYKCASFRPRYISAIDSMASPRQQQPMEVVSATDIANLIEFASKTVFRTKEADAQQNSKIQKTCENLFAKDYLYKVINNEGGVLNSTYPSAIVFLEQPVSGHNADACIRPGASAIAICEMGRLRDQIHKARNARCRARFPVPVILFEGKHICRSATLSGGPEIYSRYGYDYLFNDLPPEHEGSPPPLKSESDRPDNDNADLKESSLTRSSGDWPLFTKVRSEDIRLLEMLSVNLICDFMVEKKKVKYGVNVTSSEKVDKERRYDSFTILNLPYPGCEFFRGYRDNEYNGEGLVYDWNQAFVDASLDVPEDSITSQLNIEWSNYTTWDVVKLTQNYLKLLLKYVLDGNSGLLVHCISGWDRTPLFVSLLRISLWADGKIHQSLSPLEMTYLTIAYDWFLFGHDLPDRLEKGEEIFFFCFYMLKHLDSEEFSVQVLRGNRERRNTLEGMLDGLLLEEEVRGSNTSLNSSCSSVSSRSQELPPHLFTVPPDSGDETSLGNGNFVILGSGQSATPPTLTNSTESAPSMAQGRFCAPPSSPVAVPVSLRQRSESSSSVSAGSWQIINGTGSVRSVSTRDSLSSPPTWELNRNSSSSKGSLNSRLQDNTADSMWPRSKLAQRRRERLREVRSVVNSVYTSILAAKFSGGRADGLSGFLQKVGLRSPARATAV